MYLPYSSIVVHVHLNLHCSIWKWGPNSGYPVQRDLIAIGRNHGAGCVFINRSYGGAGIRSRHCARACHVSRALGTLAGAYLPARIPHFRHT